jgi:hypothetical protein
MKETIVSRDFLDGKQVREFLSKIPRNHIFTVIFEKQDGTLRQMTGRRDVRKALKGGVSTIAHKKNLQSVYDTGVSDYRCFDTNKVLMLRGEGYDLKVRDFDPTKHRIYSGLETETKPRFAHS